MIVSPSVALASTVQLLVRRFDGGIMTQENGPNNYNNNSE
ncbi:hypothetical protein AGRO_4830 [Agrobacterium sp. ATCC 31749]|nr:hypothetical protein AGRO_4830 [Agrobacterium sp. ATCC 31749]